jgi:pilus assembly protein CpaC
MNRRRILPVAVLTIGFLLLAVSLRAATPPAADPQEGQTVHILVGKSVMINVQVPMTRVLSSNPTAVETLAISPTQVVVEGKAAGASSLIMWDDAGHSQMLDVLVDADVSGLRSAIEHAYPDEHIEVSADAGRLILTGAVSSTAIVEDLAKMAGHYSKEVVNSVTVPLAHERQVLLEVKFAEVDRARIDQLGFNILSTGATNTVGTLSTQQFGPPNLASSGGSSSSTGSLPGKASLAVPDLLNIFLFRPDLNLGLTIKDLQQKNVLQILAEPNLMALNGQKASFLSGGEFPFPVVQGGQNVGTVTIQFRPFGVKLDFVANVQRDNVIRLHVSPEVSTLDFTNALNISGFTVPAISTRRAETEIELKDGQSFGIAGLLDRRAQVQLSKVPGIGDIPVLGQLFRSRTINKSNSELIVLVTPHIVDPVRTTSPVPADPKKAVPFLEDPKFDENLPGASAPAASPDVPGKK